MTKSVLVRAVRRSAFSLVELLVVIAIIAIIVAIIVPTLGGVRRAGKVTSTATLLSRINDAGAAFQTDERRPPGYFSAAQMGSTDNGGTMGAGGRGFSGMNNVLLDLSGGILRAGGGGVGIGSGQARVGPTRFVAEQVIVDPSLIGAPNANSKGYFMPDSKNFVKQTELQKMCTAKDHYLLPDLVDAFGNPILAWTENEAATQPVVKLEDFAQIDSGSASKPPARFYWNANATFFDSTKTLGKGGKSQSESMLGAGGSGYSTKPDVALAGFLGNPGFPNLAAGTTITDLLPAASRGKLIVHSAGPDGVFLSRYDTGGKLAGGGANPQMRYDNYFHAPGATAPYLDEAGKNKPIDFIPKFDDIVFAGGS